MTGVVQLTILLFQEGPCWVAQALEKDINAQGGSIDEALHRFVVSFAATVELNVADGLAPLEGIGPAPQRYSEMYVASYELERPVHHSVIGNTPQPWMINAMSKAVRVYGG